MLSVRGTICGWKPVFSGSDSDKMFPRMSTVRRCIIMVGVLVVCGWVWLTAPVNAPADVMNEDIHNLVRVKESAAADASSANNASRTHTPAKQVEVDANAQEKSGKHSHQHSNQTLEKLRANMTLIKANMSGVESIMLNVNRTRNGLVNSANNNSISQTGNYANPHPFEYVINTRAVCKDKDVFLIVYVHTAPIHYKRRMVIRQTYGNSKYYNVKVRVVFVMGYTHEKPAIQQALLFEAEQYNDIVQENFEDSYRNLTYKGVAGLKWVSNHCAHAKFVLKTDDDIFVNMFTLLRHLMSLDRMGVDNKGTLLCLVWYKMKVMRTGKWKVDPDQWKDDYYPTYCSGSAFTMTTDVALAMYNVSYHVPFFWVDDFYITGLLPLKLNGKVKHKQFMSTYVLDGKKLEEKFTGPQWFTYIFSHVHDLNVIQSVWERLVKLSSGKVSPTIKYALPGHLPKPVEEDPKAKPAKPEKPAAVKQL